MLQKLGTLKSANIIAKIKKRAFRGFNGNLNKGLDGKKENWFCWQHYRRGLMAYIKRSGFNENTEKGVDGSNIENRF